MNPAVVHCSGKFYAILFLGLVFEVLQLWPVAIQCACHVINHLPSWPGKERSPFEILYHEKPNVNHFRYLVQLVMFIFQKLTEPNLIQKQKSASLLAMIHIGKGGGVWILKPRN